MLTQSPVGCVCQVCLSTCSWGDKGGPGNGVGQSRKQQIDEG